MADDLRDDHARLRARPAPGAPAAAPGTSVLPGGALLRVPRGATAGVPMPLAVAFHGAGSSAHAGLALFADTADDVGLLVVAPQSRGRTWDLIAGGYGPDVERMDGVLAHVFATCPVDAGRIALAGFSDGASYALSLAVGNGDLVTHAVAFSPGFVAPGARRGQPRIFVSHGTADPVLPVERCSRRIVPRLRRAGHEVTYVEFDGGHVVGPELARRAAAWLGAG